MDKQQIGLKLALDVLERDLLLSSFDERLVIQKTVYLVQAAKVDLGYAFHWYLRGPYSPGLTRDAFALKAELPQNADELKDWAFDPTSVKRLTRLRNMLKAISPTDLSRRLELLASVHFLLRTRQAKEGEISGLRAVLLSNGKDFSEGDIRRAIEELKQHDLRPPAEPR
jgi:hypothetical protein